MSHSRNSLTHGPYSASWHPDRTMTKTTIVSLASDHASQIIEGGNYDLLKIT